jgi:methyl-accepting chemotaxis protein
LSALRHEDISNSTQVLPRSTTKALHLGAQPSSDELNIADNRKKGLGRNTMRLSLGKKLGIGFGVVLCLVACSSVLTYSRISRMRAFDIELVEVRLPEIAASKELSGLLSSSANKVRDYILTADQDPELANRAKKDWGNVWAGIEADVRKLEELSPRFTLQANRDRLIAIRDGVTELHKMQENALAIRDSRRSDVISESARYMSAVQTPFDKKIRASLKDMLESFEDLTKKDERSLSAAASATYLMLAVSTLLAIGFGSGAAIVISRRIARDISEVLQRAKAIAVRDLSGEQLEVRSQDEIGELVGAMNEMQSSLTGVIEQVTSSAEHVASASEEISASATQQSQGMGVQKDQTQQVATAMHEMTSSVGQISESSSRAADAAQKASEAAQGGGRIVEQTLDNIQSIATSVSETAHKIEALGKSSDQIGKIIGVIDDIADQTNLLALNAAIEAARAGEQGRGFAVVADEVRKLAERTSTATKEIAGMIEGIQQETRNAVEAMQSGTKKVEFGVETTRQAGESLREIIASAGQVGEMVTQIATAAHQQTSVTEEVNRNLEQIAKVTGETATGAQQSAKACQELSNLAFDLQNVVGQFKIGQTTGGQIAAQQKTSSAPARTRRRTSTAHPMTGELEPLSPPTAERTDRYIN